MKLSDLRELCYAYHNDEVFRNKMEEFLDTMLSNYACKDDETRLVIVYTKETPYPFIPLYLNEDWSRIIIRVEVKYKDCRNKCYGSQDIDFANTAILRKKREKSREENRERLESISKEHN
jgi:hypothetical protein